MEDKSDLVFHDGYQRRDHEVLLSIFKDQFWEDSESNSYIKSKKLGDLCRYCKCKEDCR